MKHLLTLIAALLIILLITQLEDYLGQTDISRLTMEKDQIDYYLADFSVMAVANDGTVSYELAGRHLSHWQAQKQSLIIAPQIRGEGKTADERLQLRADEARIDQNTRIAELDGNVQVLKPASGQQEEFRLQTARLSYNMQSREIFTAEPVSITSPSGTMQSTGLAGKLDENLLRFNANVRSTYQVNQ